MSQLSADECREEIQKVHDKVKKLTGKDMILFRPPYGDYNDTLIETANGLGYHVIQWDVDSLDWSYKNRQRVVNKVCKEVEDGDIILMHDIFQSSEEAALEIIDRLQAEGWQFVTVEEVMID